MLTRLFPDPNNVAFATYSVRHVLVADAGNAPLFAASQDRIYGPSERRSARIGPALFALLYCLPWS